MATGIIARKRLNIHKSPKRFQGSLQVWTAESSMLSVLEAFAPFVRCINVFPPPQATPLVKGTRVNSTVRLVSLLQWFGGLRLRRVET
jgi:hypothetical protein